jgi:hypothetical protein
MHGWPALRMPVAVLGCDGIVLGCHDHKRMFVNNFFREFEKILQVPVLGVFSEISLSPQKPDLEVI